MNSSNRSIRRHHRKRLYKKRKNYWGVTADRNVGKSVINTPKPCSCFMCGNPRKYYNLPTVQEKRAALHYGHYQNSWI